MSYTKPYTVQYTILSLGSLTHRNTALLYPSLSSTRPQQSFLFLFLSYTKPTARWRIKLQNLTARWRIKFRKSTARRRFKLQNLTARWRFKLSNPTDRWRIRVPKSTARWRIKLQKKFSARWRSEFLKKVPPLKYNIPSHQGTDLTLCHLHHSGYTLYKLRIIYISSYTLLHHIYL